MNAQQRAWLDEAVEVSLPVAVAEQFTLWTVADEASLECLLVSVGWELWHELQDYLESHPECRFHYSGNYSAWEW